VSLFDNWTTGFGATVSDIAKGLVGAALAWLALRKRVSSDSADIKDIAMKSSWTERLVKKTEEQEALIDNLRTAQLNDARHIAKVEADAIACRERMAEALMERALALEEKQQARSRAAACDERVILLTDENTDLRLANGRLLKELAVMSAEAADRFLLQHLRPNGEVKDKG
jgi:protein-tyrosine-phosphatase